MRDADVFVALISDSYVADPQCMEVFLYARHTLRKPLLLVALGDGFEWRKSKLGLLVANEVSRQLQNLFSYMANVLVFQGGTHVNHKHAKCSCICVIQLVGCEVLFRFFLKKIV